MDKVREWSSAYNYPHGAYVLYTETPAVARRVRNWTGMSGVQRYYKGDRLVARDFIFPKKASKKYNCRLREKLEAFVEPEG